MLTALPAGQARRLRRALPALVAVASLLIAAACGSSEGDSSSPDPGAPEVPATSTPRPTATPAATLPLTLTNAGGESFELLVEVAQTREQRAKGLSGRQSLGEDAGMLFVIPQQGIGFYMRDTYIPLTVAFIDCSGEIVALVDMEPLSLELHNTEREYHFGLEANQGWFAERGLDVGARVDLPQHLLEPAACPQGD